MSTDKAMVTDAMVDAAVSALDITVYGKDTKEKMRKAIHAAIYANRSCGGFSPAALAQAEQPVAVNEPGNGYYPDDPSKLKRMLEQRDKWIVASGNWSAFVATLAHPPAKREAGETAPAPVQHLRGPNFGSHGSATAMFDVIDERLRQQEKEGWTPEHDAQHTDGSLANAAACYALTYDEMEERQSCGACGAWSPFKVPRQWPSSWSPRWWKRKDRRRDLVRAAALIIAEIERLDRAALAITEGKDNG